MIYCSMPFYYRMQPRIQAVGCYHIVEVLGKGGQGLVYKAVNVNNGTVVAVKEMLAGKAQLKRIKTEICFLKTLDNTHIVKYLDVIIKDHKVYLVLEYIEGGSLAALARRSLFPESLVRLYVAQILEGLVYLHRAGVIHRDIKGANILLTKEGIIKIADFGVAVSLNDNQRTLSSAGTPYWMPPEAISGQQEYSPKADIWSLGCTVIQLLTGNPPYAELGSFPALIRIVEDPLPPFPLASPQCLLFLHCCFKKDTSMRASADQLQRHEWFGASEKEEESIISKCFRPVNINQLLRVAREVPNKKLIYLSPDFMKLMEIPNCVAKVELLEELIRSDAGDYLEQIGMIGSTIAMECGNPQLNSPRMLQFLRECYYAGARADQFHLVHNGSLNYIALALQHKDAAPLAFSLLRKVLSDQMINPAHLVYHLKASTLLDKTLQAYNAGSELQTVMEILVRVGECEASAIEPTLEKAVNITLHFREVELCLLNLQLLEVLMGKLEDRMESCGLATYLAQFFKLLVISKRVSQAYVSLVEKVLRLAELFMRGKEARLRHFVKCGGTARLKGLPHCLMLTGRVPQGISRLLQLIAVLPIEG